MWGSDCSIILAGYTYSRWNHSLWQSLCRKPWFHCFWYEIDGEQQVEEDRSLAFLLELLVILIHRYAALVKEPEKSPVHVLWTSQCRTSRGSDLRNSRMLLQCYISLLAITWNSTCDKVGRGLTLLILEMKNLRFILKFAKGCQLISSSVLTMGSNEIVQNGSSTDWPETSPRPLPMSDL